MNILGRIAIGRIPTPKLVSIIVVLRTLRNIPIVGHWVLDGVVALLQDFAVPVQPADMVLVQGPLGVEGDIFVGGDVCLVGIGLAGAVSCRVPTGEIIVRAGEGVGGQDSRLIGLHGLGTHGALAIIGHKGNDRIHRPLRVKGGVRVEAHDRFVGIGRAGTVCLGIPAGEGVAFASERVCVQCGIGLRIYGLRVHRAFDRVFRISVGFKGNSQSYRLFAAPDAIDIVDNITSVCGRSFGVRAVCVV